MGSRVLAFLVGVTLVSASSACTTEDHPGRREASEIADRITVNKFSEAYRYAKGSTIKIGMTGPVDADLGEIVSVPGWRSRRVEDGLAHGRVYVRVLTGEVASDGDFYCELEISRLREGVLPPYERGLSAEELDGIESGRLAFIEVAATCLPERQGSLVKGN